MQNELILTKEGPPRGGKRCIIRGNCDLQD